jgi:squalene synthase HpnC
MSGQRATAARDTSSEVDRAPVTLEQAYAACRRIALGSDENFNIASWLLPRDLRRHIYAVYAYCRGVDDIGDEAGGDRTALLDEWETELRRSFDGAPRDARFVALADTVRRFEIPPEPFERLIEANRRDQRVGRYETFADLLDYCTYSANPVGRMVLYLFGYRDAERQRLADATCTALQLTDFWQDVSQDLAKGRVYIPLEDMRRFSVTDDDLRGRRITEGMRSLLKFEVLRAREFLREGLPLIGMVRGRLRLDVKLFTLGGLAVLDEIERREYDVVRERPTLSKARKALIALRGLMPVRINAGTAG